MVRAVAEYMAKMDAGGVEGMRLAICTSHAGADSLGEAIASWTGMKPVDGTPVFGWQEGQDPPIYVAEGSNGMLQGYQKGFQKSRDYDLLAFFHDDTIIKEPGWVDRVMREFETCQTCWAKHDYADRVAYDHEFKNDVGLVGFGGALVHGSPELYKRPYEHTQLGRSYYLSNVDDAEVHGARFTGSNDVAVLDGFALIARRSLLERCGGWPVGRLDYMCYDYWICAMARRNGYRIRVVGVRCHHLGGRTAVALKKADETGAEYDKAHKFIYNEFRDQLPYSCLP